MSDGIVKTLLAGAMDLGGVATNASYDFAKFIGSKALRRLLDPKIRERIQKDACQRMISRGVPAEQAKFLTALVEEKEFLQRGAMQDVARLSELIQKEVSERGYFPFEAEVLYQALVEALAGELASNSFVGSMLAGTYLATHPTPFAQDILYQFAQALREPEKLGGDLLGRILQEAGQHNAKLLVGADGQLELVGEYSFQINADAPDAGKLYDALQRVQGGETVVIEASKIGSIRFTTGHSILDRIQGFDRHPQAVRFSPTPRVFKRTLHARVREFGEVAVDAQITLFPNREGLSITLVDRPGFKFVITMTQQWFRWDFHIDWKEFPPQYEDRKVMKFLMYAAHPHGKIMDEKGKQLLRLSDRSEEFRRLSWVAETNLYIIDLHHFTTHDLNGQFNILLPELDDKEFKTLRDMARCARDELDGIEQNVRGDFLITDDFISSLTGKNSKNGLYVEMTQFLALPDSMPLKLTKDFVRPRITLRQNGKRIPRARWHTLIGQAAEVEFSGPVSHSTLTVNHAQELPTDDSTEKTESQL